MLAKFKAIVKSDQTVLIHDFALAVLLCYAQNTPIFAPLYFLPLQLSLKQPLA